MNGTAKRIPALALACLTMAPAPTRAMQADSLGWAHTGKLTAVWAAGNSESSTFGVGSTLRFRARQSELRFDASAVRTDTGLRERRAIGTTTSFRVDETTTWEKTAEAYSVRGRYDWRVSPAFVLFVGADWMRNTFAGIDSRTLFALGAGNIWVSRDDFRFKTDYGFTWTFQSDVVQNPFLKTNFPGARVTWNLMRRLTQTTTFDSELISDFNFQESGDVRFDFTNALSLSISNVLALKPGLQLLWRNQPALTEVELFSPTGEPTGEKVTVPLQKLDSFFTLAVVLTTG